MTRWIWRGGALAALLIGWVFIAWQNHFHITAPTVFVCLGYLAVVATVYNLWRTGAAVAASPEDEGDSTWAKPAGARGELEREKRTLLKAIKEAEFDHQMGKLSQRDADDMIRTYRARAIEVLKEIAQLELGSAGSTREQILREVRARIGVVARSQKNAGAEPKPGAKPAGSKAEAARGQHQQNHQRQKHRSLAEDGATPTDPAAAATPVAAATPGPDDAAPQPTEMAEAGEAAVAHSDDGHAATPRPSQGAARTDLADLADTDDDAMNADSTTVPVREDAAKEATP